MNLKKIIRETVKNCFYESNLLNEDVKLAEKYLKNSNISLDDELYKSLKDELAKKNSIGYLGPIVKIVLTPGPRMWGKNSVEHVKDFIFNNKELIKDLPQPLIKYDDFFVLEKDVKRVSDLKILKKLTRKLTNKNLIEMLISDQRLDCCNKLYFISEFLKIESADQKEFLAKTDKYRDIQTFYSNLQNFIEENKTGFYFHRVLKQIKSMSSNEIKLLYADNKMILARIIQYSASAAIGSKSWCIVGGEQTFYDYLDGGKNNQYFFFNFNDNIKPNLKMIAFTMNPENKITASHDRYDGVFDNPVSYLNDLGIKSRIFEINTRENLIKNLEKFDDSKYTGHVEYFDHDKVRNALNFIYDERPNKNRDSSKKLIIELRPENNFYFLIKKMKKDFLSYLLQYEGKNIDLIVKKMQEIPAGIIKYPENADFIGLSYFKNAKNVNIFQYLNKEDIETYGINDINIILESLKKIITSNINITQDTKRSILRLLKDFDVDILKLSQAEKTKKGKDLTDTEFNMLQKRGEDFKPIIQNKLAALRRGENVNISPAEIKYAIDNGYEKIIKKYYLDLLPYFSENQLSFDDLDIYKKLGLFNDVSKIIKRKGEYWGLDSLNSIERSVYDYAK